MSRRPLSQLLDGPEPAPTREQLRAGIDALLALCEAIRSLGSVPSGVLYAHVMGVMSIDAYASAVATMKSTAMTKSSRTFFLSSPVYCLLARATRSPPPARIIAMMKMKS